MAEWLGRQLGWIAGLVALVALLAWFAMLYMFRDVL